jgi:hypothetical protein
MRYRMLVCVDPSADPFDPAQDNIAEWVASHDANGTRIMGHRLTDRAQARTVRVVTDGPFAETKKWIPGFDLLECASLEEGIRIASRHPVARFSRIEVRPLSAED